MVRSTPSWSTENVDGARKKDRETEGNLKSSRNISLLPGSAQICNSTKICHKTQKNDDINRQKWKGRGKRKMLSEDPELFPQH